MESSCCWSKSLLVLLSCFQLAAVVLAQNPANATDNSTNGALDPQIVSAQDSCIGVFLTYEVVETPTKIYPHVPAGSGLQQPYSFRSQVTLTNTGFEPVTQWEVSISFQYNESIAEAPGVLFLSGLKPPGLNVGNDTRIIGVDKPGLLTSIDTAQNEDLISARFTLLGTEFGVDDTGVPLPKDISLVNTGYACGDLSTNATASRQMWICCTENATAINSTERVSGFLARETGDITMTYDIMSAFTDNYWAQVSMSMDDPLGRIDHWTLSWEWRQGEFIDKMKGAQILGPNDQDQCVLGTAAEQYPQMDFQFVMSCSSTPTIVDLTPDRKDDPNVGIPRCCRNGTLLPELIDPSQTKSNFQVLVRKLIPHKVLDDISPPVNWKIGEGYKCGQPRQVSPSEFDPEALHSSSAVASWQVVCNRTTSTVKKCCVSFSAFFNSSLIPCKTCSCGCSENTLPWNGEVCNPKIDPILLPYNGVLLPPSNRTALGKQLAKIDHYQVPRPLPCPDNCGVSLNWHVYSDYKDGWSARLTMLNWDKTPVPQWFAAVEMPAAMRGFQNVYSFNGSKVSTMNNTLFMDGHDGYDNDYLLAKDAKDNPGKLQSVLSFDKKKTPGIQVVQGDGYPTKVWFNGEECTIPDSFPTGSGQRVRPTVNVGIVLFATILLLWGNGMMSF